MLIRSQDKEKIVVLEKVNSIEIEGQTIRAYGEIPGNSVMLGLYSKRKQLLDVLDDICSAYQYNCAFGGTGSYFVYYMPMNREEEQ